MRLRPISISRRVSMCHYVPTGPERECEMRIDSTEVPELGAWEGAVGAGLGQKTLGSC